MLKVLTGLRGRVGHYAKRLRGATKAPPPISPPAAPSPPTIVHPGSGDAPFPLLIELMEAFARDAPPEILVLGDSVMERTSRHDADRRTLGRLIVEALPQPCHVASRTALSPALALALIRCFRRLQPPRMVVLPVNVRAFSPQWDLNPGIALNQELAIIETWLSDPGAPIVPLRDIRKTPDLYRSYHATPVDYPLSRLSTIGEFREAIAATAEDEASRQRRKREIFVFHYTHELTARHRKLIDLVSAVGLCRDLGIEPVLYVTPINVEAGRELVGEEFAKTLGRNVAVVREALKPLAELHDYSDLLPAADFFAEDLATEHLNQSGRSKLAQRVATTIGA